MTRAGWLSILGLVLVVAVALLLWPTGSGPTTTSDLSDGAAEAVELGPLASSAGAGAAVPAGSKPSEVFSDAAAGRTAAGPENLGPRTRPPHAKVVVRLVGENDEPLRNGHAGVVPMPGGDLQMENLQDLYLAMYGRPSEGFALAEGSTDDGGLATVPIPEAGEQQEGWGLYGRAPGRLLAYRMLPPLDPGTTRDEGKLRLNPGGRIALTILDEEGDPVDQASAVLVNEEGITADELPIHFQRSDPAGKVLFTHLGLGKYKLEVARQGYLTHHQEGVELVAEAPTELEILLDRGAEIEGQVVDAHGRGVEGVAITLRPRDRKLSPEGLTQMFLGPEPWQTSDPQGFFHGRGLVAEQHYRLEAEPYPEVRIRSDWVVPGDFVTLEVPPVARVSGTVFTADDEPAIGARLRFRQVDLEAGRPGEGWTRETDGEGRFELLLPHGRYHVAAWHPEGELIYPRGLEISQDQDLAFALPRGATLVLTSHTPTGDVTRDVGLARVDAGLQLAMPDGVDWVMRDLRRLRETHWELGALVAPGLSPGPVTIETRSKRFLSARLDLRLPPGARAAVGVDLQPICSLRVSLHDAEGKTLRGRQLRLVPEGFAGRGELDPRRSDRRGRVQFSRLQAGQYRLEYGRADGAGGVRWELLQRVLIEQNDQQLELSLTE